MNKKQMVIAFSVCGVLAAAVVFYRSQKKALTQAQQVVTVKKLIVDSAWRKNSLKSENLEVAFKKKIAEPGAMALSLEERQIITSALADWKELRTKVIKTPQEKSSWERSLASASFLGAVARVVASPEISKDERLDATQVLIESFAANKQGPAKAVILSLVSDGKMDQTMLPQPVRLAAAEDRAELLFHYLATFPEERSALQQKMSGANAKIVFRNIAIEHSANSAVSQRMASTNK